VVEGERNQKSPSAETRGLLAANRDFYRIVVDRDVPAMETLWARSVPVACIHPGWPPLVGRDRVLQSWNEILRSAQAPAIRCHEEYPLLYDGFGLVICLEVINGALLAATNVFIREDGAWRLINHQASPVAAAIAEQLEEALTLPRGRLN
jgi:hypothetical protein